MKERVEKWSCFYDPSYFDLWAIQHCDRKAFDEGLHVYTRKEAEFLVAQLNELDVAKENQRLAIEALERCSKDYQGLLETAIKQNWTRVIIDTKETIAYLGEALSTIRGE